MLNNNEINKKTLIYEKKLFLEIFILSIVIAVIHFFASKYSLYWTIDWLDILMHFLGGFLIGLIAVFIFFISGYIHYPKEHTLVVISSIFGTVLIVGLTWELWEVFVGFTDVINDLGDTIFDMIMDMIGAMAAYYYSRNKL